MSLDLQISYEVTANELERLFLSKLANGSTVSEVGEVLGYTTAYVEEILRGFINREFPQDEGQIYTVIKEKGLIKGYLTPTEKSHLSKLREAYTYLEEWISKDLSLSKFKKKLARADDLQRSLYSVLNKGISPEEIRDVLGLSDVQFRHYIISLRDYLGQNGKYTDWVEFYTKNLPPELSYLNRIYTYFGGNIANADIAFHGIYFNHSNSVLQARRRLLKTLESESGYKVFYNSPTICPAGIELVRILKMNPIPDDMDKLYDLLIFNIDGIEKPVNIRNRFSLSDLFDHVFNLTYPSIERLPKSNLDKARLLRGIILGRVEIQWRNYHV